MSIPALIDPAPTASIKSKTYPFAEEDWQKAEPALIAAIRADASDEPAQWSNAASGRKGAIEAVGSRYKRGGANCRMFIARISDADEARAIQGAACLKAGEVTVSDAGPLKSL